MSEVTLEVGQLIRRTRRAKGLTTEELGEKMGVVAATVERYESGRQNLTVNTLDKIAKALDVSLKVLLE
jgi:transcriptional regulator with XRE-family HTH domain